MKIRYIVATDTSKDTLLRITRRVSQSLGNGKVKVVDQEEAMLNRDITVIKSVFLIEDFYLFVCSFVSKQIMICY